MDAAALAGLNSFGIFDVEADRIDHFFAGLDAAGWAKPSRCAGWSVQDVLAHLARPAGLTAVRPGGHQAGRPRLRRLSR